MSLPRKATAKRATQTGGAISLRASRHFEFGVQCHRAGRIVEAGKAYRLAIAADPHNATAFNNLGMISPVADKTALFRRALALQPGFADAHVNLAGLLAEQGDAEGAVTHYLAALDQRPEWPEVLYALGGVYQTLGLLVEAANCFQNCIALKPDYAPAVCSLACVFALAGMKFGSEEADVFALQWFRRAAELAPDLEFVNFQLAKLLEDRGRFVEAQPYRQRVSKPLPVDVTPAKDHKRTVLVACTPARANTPFRTLLPEKTNSLVIWHIDYATDAQQRALPPHDLVFYAVANPDRDRECLERALRFAQESDKPVLNPPESIQRTRRDALPQLLAGIPNVEVAPVLRLSREEIAGGDLSARLEAAGLAFPLIVRPFGHQGGIGMILVETAADLAGQSLDDAEYYYFIGYHDYRSSDGLFRKYRTIYVDRKPFPYHLAISPNWLVHYFSASMLDQPSKQAEERRFLEAPDASIGPRAQAAIAAIGERLDMDYAGVDYTILPDGRVFVFEANATMSAYIPAEPELAYKARPVEAIFDAFEDMLERKAPHPRVPPAPPAG